MVSCGITDIMSKVDPLTLPNRLNVRNRKGLVLVAEVYPSVEPGTLSTILGNWKRRNKSMGRPVNMLFEPFGVYFHVTSVPVAWSGEEPVLHLGFGDSSDPLEKPTDLLVGGTRYLMRLIGWESVENARLLGHAKNWFEKVGGNPAPYLPNCPGSMGIAREWIRTLLKEAVEVEVERGLGLKDAEASSPVRAPVPDPAE